MGYNNVRKEKKPAKTCKTNGMRVFLLCLDMDLSEGPRLGAFAVPAVFPSP